MKKFVRLLAAISFVSPLVMVGLAQPASAGFGDMRDYCRLGAYCLLPTAYCLLPTAYCLMGDANWRMCISLFEGSDANYVDNACYDGMVGFYLDNAATSVFNNGYAGAVDDIQSFRHPNYVEMIWFVPQGNYYSNVDNWCGALPCNDQASSHRWV